MGLDRGIDPGVLDRAYAFSSTTTADGWNQDFGNRTRFGLVPEPGTALLVAFGLAGLGLQRKS